MAGIRDPDASTRRSLAVATLIICAAAVGVPYACDRVYRRWLGENHPFAGPLARLERLRSGYRDRRERVIEGARVIGSVFVDVARATSM